MKAMTIDSFGGVEKLKLSDITLLPPEADEVQIKVIYAGVNPVDWKIREGLLKDRMPHEFPIVLGWDASGKISAVGKNVQKFKIGDEVYAYCRKPTIQWGTYAEYVNMEAIHVALKPKKFNFSQAASIPLAGLTAWQSLFDCAKLKQGEKVLIHAGAGGVGSLAIQLAKSIHAFVYTTASEANREYVKSLGADVVIDYRRDNFVDVIKKLEPAGIEVVFYTVGEKTLSESAKVLKPGGRLVSILGKLPEETRQAYQIEDFYVYVRPNGEELKKLSELIDQDKIHPPKMIDMPLKDAGLAQ